MSRQRKKGKGEGRKHANDRYKDYISPEDADLGVQKGELFESRIRFNAADIRQAFCTIDGLPSDVFIRGAVSQNRTIDGDCVTVRILPEAEWYQLKSRGGRREEVTDNGCDSMVERLKEVRISSDDHKLGLLEQISSTLDKEHGKLRATGEVVCIKEFSKKRDCVIGTLKIVKNRDLRFVPNDTRLPKGAVCDENNVISRKRWKEMDKSLYEARVKEWSISELSPIYEIIDSLGPCDDLDVQANAILAGEKIESLDVYLDEAIVADLPQMPWRIPAAEIDKRRDLRGCRIFSIDPPSARDLDDALSIEYLSDGLFRVGVHIADVSYFVRAGTALDSIADKRSTSVYTVGGVISMLPRVLCEDLCSLKPGQERLCMSILWEMDGQGNISDTWVGRTVIRSCAQLTYLDAQESIQREDSNPPNELLIHGDHTWGEISRDVKSLHAISQAMRKRRFSKGSLALDNVQVRVETDDTGYPIKVSKYEIWDANHLVEEFMLAANITAAEMISKAYPDSSILRCHPQPNMEQLQNICQAIERSLSDPPTFAIDSSGSFQRSLQSIEMHLEDPLVFQAIMFLCTKPMPNAAYIHTGDVTDKEGWRHYALNVPFYTHFTSPIRRYPDIIVHRMLVRAIEGNAVDSVSGRSLSMIAAHANERKLAAKAAQDSIQRLHFSFFFRKIPTVFISTVCSVGGSKFFDVYINELGIDMRIFVSDLVLEHKSGTECLWDEKQRTLEIKVSSKPSMEKTTLDFASVANPNNISKVPLPATLSPFSLVPIVIYGREEPFRGHESLRATIWGE